MLHTADQLIAQQSWFPLLPEIALMLVRVAQPMFLFNFAIGTLITKQARAELCQS